MKTLFKWLANDGRRLAIMILSWTGLIIILLINHFKPPIKNVGVPMPEYLIPASTFGGGSYYLTDLGDGMPDWVMQCAVCTVPGEVKVFYFLDGKGKTSILYTASWKSGDLDYGYTEVFEQDKCYSTNVGTFRFETHFLEETSYGGMWEITTIDC